MTRKRSCQDWCQYHKGQAEKAAANSAGAAERAELKRLEDELAALESSLALLSSNKLSWGVFASLFSTSDKKALRELESKVQIASAARNAVASPLNQVVAAAARAGGLSYGQDCLDRRDDKLESIAARQESYRERAPSLRGEQQSLKSSCCETRQI